MKNSDFSIFTEIEINRRIESVWSCLTDLQNYSAWNQFITNVEGPLKTGCELKIDIHPLGKKNQKYKVLITDLVLERKLSWLGHFYIKGLIDGHHTLELIPIDQNRTKVIHRETFVGVLVPFVWKSFILSRLKPGFLDFNSDLKAYLES